MHKVQDYHQFCNVFRIKDGKKIALGELSETVHSFEINKILRMGAFPQDFCMWQGIERERIEKFLDNPETRPVSTVDTSKLSGEELKDFHAARIAYFVRNPDELPIYLAVGRDYGREPGKAPKHMGETFQGLEVIDGNHRLAAAIFSKQTSIAVQYFGKEVDFARLQNGALPKQVITMPKLNSSGDVVSNKMGFLEMDEVTSIMKEQMPERKKKEQDEAIGRLHYLNDLSEIISQRLNSFENPQYVWDTWRKTFLLGGHPSEFAQAISVDKNVIAGKADGGGIFAYLLTARRGDYDQHMQSLGIEKSFTTALNMIEQMCLSDNLPQSEPLFSESFMESDSKNLVSSLKTKFDCILDENTINPAPLNETGSNAEIDNAIKVGLELEGFFVSNSSEAVQRKYLEQVLADAGAVGWSVTRDTSIQTPVLVKGESIGWEVISPPLTGDKLEAVPKIFNRLKEAGFTNNYSCGLHVHVDVADNLEDIKRLATEYIAQQPMLLHEISVDRHSALQSTASAIKPSDLEVANNATSVGTFIKSLQNCNRYSALNLMNVLDPDKPNTVEFRMLPACLDFNKALPYINYFLDICQQTPNLELVDIEV